MLRFLSEILILSKNIDTEFAQNIDGFDYNLTNLWKITQKVVK